MDQGNGRVGTKRLPVVFVSASAADAQELREITGREWLVVNVPDLTGAVAVIEKLRPEVVVCDTDVEGNGSWRNLLALSLPAFALIVAASDAGDALWAEVTNAGGFGVIEKPFTAAGVECAIGLDFACVRGGARGSFAG
jgi:AmiR/NasT family two-component response regulator